MTLGARYFLKITPNLRLGPNWVWRCDPQIIRCEHCRCLRISSFQVYPNMTEKFEGLTARTVPTALIKSFIFCLAYLFTQIIDPWLFLCMFLILRGRDAAGPFLCPCVHWENFYSCGLNRLLFILRAPFSCAIRAANSSEKEKECCMSLHSVSCALGPWTPHCSLFICVPVFSGVSLWEDLNVCFPQFPPCPNFSPICVPAYVRRRLWSLDTLAGELHSLGPVCCNPSLFDQSHCYHWSPSIQRNLSLSFKLLQCFHWPTWSGSTGRERTSD